MAADTSRYVIAGARPLTHHVGTHAPTAVRQRLMCERGSWCATSTAGLLSMGWPVVIARSGVRATDLSQSHHLR
jgi:hypothetical protein